MKTEIDYQKEFEFFRKRHPEEYAMIKKLIDLRDSSPEFLEAKIIDLMNNGLTQGKLSFNDEFRMQKLLGYYIDKTKKEQRILILDELAKKLEVGMEYIPFHITNN